MVLLRPAVTAALLFGAAHLPRAAAQYKIGTRQEILDSSSALAYDLMLFYHGNESGQIPGILPGPPTEGKGDYYWWEGGAMMGTYIDYWHFTGDESYNKVVTEGMLHQTGPYHDYMPPNFTASLGNDDQGFWGLSAMLAAETRFPNPPADKPQWLALAQAVFNTQAAPDRHDETCGGGLRWQIPLANGGYNYKNTIANGCFFDLGARLARYTGNETYAKWATDTWDWLWGVHYIDNQTWKVYDGADVETNCTKINRAQFSYNAAILLHGSAFMYNYTNGSALWRNRVEKLTESMLRDFFPDDIVLELPCEARQSCTPDMLTYKGFVHRWLSAATQVAPFVADRILPVLAKSAAAAAAQCTGPRITAPDGRTGRGGRCGFYWATGKYVDPSVDKTSGAGEQMSVLGAISSLLIREAAPPVTNATGGISRGDPGAGTGGPSGGRLNDLGPITTADRAGAGIVTFVLLGSAVSMWAWMSLD